jgi:hypothetical protein
MLPMSAEWVNPWWQKTAAMVIFLLAALHHLGEPVGWSRPSTVRPGIDEDHVLRLPGCSFDFRRRFPAPDGLSKPTRALFVFRVVLDAGDQRGGDGVRTVRPLQLAKEQT